MEPRSRPDDAGLSAARARPGQIVVPLDGSDDARRALPIAGLLSARFGVPVNRVMVSVQTPRAPRDDLRVHEDMLSLVRGANETTARSSTPVSGAAPLAPPPPPPVVDHVAVVTSDGDADTVLQGELPGSLLAYLKDHSHSLLCMATHARGGLHRRLVGNLTEVLLTEAVCPVLAIGPAVDPAGAALRPRTILVAASDHLPPATVPMVAAWAISMDAEVVVAHVTVPTAAGPSQMPLTQRLYPPVVERLVQAFARHGIAATGQGTGGPQIATRLLELADGLAGPLLLAAPVGTRHDRVPADVTYQLLQRSRWPVLASVGRLE